MAVLISSVVFTNGARLRQIEEELLTELDEAKRRSLLVERDIKKDLQTRLLAAAVSLRKRTKRND